MSKKYSIDKSVFGGIKPHDQYVGIDISKANLDVFWNGKYQRYENSSQGVLKLIKKFQSADTTPIAVFESTGFLSKRLVQSFALHSIPYAHLNPVIARRYAQYKQVYAKTDKIDCQILAMLGAEAKLTPHNSLPIENYELKELSTLIESYTKDIVAAKNQLKAMDTAYVIKSLKKHITRLEKSKQELEKRMDEIIDKSPKLRELKTTFLCVQGIGPGAIRELLTNMPELGTMNRKQISSLLGVAPFANESGTVKNKRIIKWGRRSMRRHLYMPILSACCSGNCKGVLHDYYFYLVNEKHKHCKVALIACMRKLIIYLNSLARLVLEKFDANQKVNWKELLCDKKLTLNDLRKI